MAAKYDHTALIPKYGGNVIEVDGKIILATDERMTKQIDELIKKLEGNDPELKAEPKTSKRRDLNIPVPLWHQCSHSGCYFHSICLTYSNCHVCRRPTGRRGYCI